MRYAAKRTCNWSSDLAYLTGLFASDGCLVNNCRHLVMTSTDIQIINFVKSIAQTNAHERIKFGGYSGSPAYHLQFSNVALYDFFVDAGLTPAKSLTMPALRVPDSLFTDFLPALERKRSKLDGFVAADNTVIMCPNARVP